MKFKKLSLLVLLGLCSAQAQAIDWVGLGLGVSALAGFGSMLFNKVIASKLLLVKKIPLNNVFWGQLEEGANKSRVSLLKDWQMKNEHYKKYIKNEVFDIEECRKEYDNAIQRKEEKKAELYKMDYHDSSAYDNGLVEFTTAVQDVKRLENMLFFYENSRNEFENGDECLKKDGFDAFFQKKMRKKHFENFLDDIRVYCQKNDENESLVKKVLIDGQDQLFQGPEYIRNHKDSKTNKYQKSLSVARCSCDEMRKSFRLKYKMSFGFGVASLFGLGYRYRKPLYKNVVSPLLKQTRSWTKQISGI